MGSAKEVAELVYFLGEDTSSYITGQVINVDGGMIGIEKFLNLFKTVLHNMPLPLIISLPNLILQSKKKKESIKWKKE